MFFTTCFYPIFECTHKICQSHIQKTTEVSIILLVQVHVFSLTWLYFIWLKLSSIWWGYFLCNLVNCCFVIVAHNKIIAKKWQSVRLANVLASRSALNDIYLPSLILSPPSFFPPPLLLLTPLTGVESSQTKWHLKDRRGSFSHLCLEMVECSSHIIESS